MPRIRDGFRIARQVGAPGLAAVVLLAWRPASSTGSALVVEVGGNVVFVLLFSGAALFFRAAGPVADRAGKTA